MVINFSENRTLQGRANTLKRFDKNLGNGHYIFPGRNHIPRPPPLLLVRTISHFEGGGYIEAPRQEFYTTLFRRPPLEGCFKEWGCKRLWPRNTHVLSGHYSREWSECIRVNGVNE